MHRRARGRLSPVRSLKTEKYGLRKLPLAHVQCFIIVYNAKCTKQVLW